jgi:hypothetical protein
LEEDDARAAVRQWLGSALAGPTVLASNQAATTNKN